MVSRSAMRAPKERGLFTDSDAVVFDQTNRELSMAPYVNCGSSEQSIPTGAGAVGNIQGQCAGNAAAGGPTSHVGMAVAGLVVVQLLMALF